MSLLMKLKFDTKVPLIARTGGRALVGSINFSISNLIQQHLRQERFGLPAAGVDQYNDEIAGAEAAEEATRNREEQGYSIAEPPLKLAAKLKQIRDSLQQDLVDHAAQRPMVTNPSKTMPDTFHVGLAFEESLDFQTKMQVRISEPQVIAEAKALDIDPQEIRQALITRHSRQMNFLKDNAKHIVELYNGLSTGVMEIEDADDVFNGLPAVVRMRLAAAADRVLFNARAREIQRHMAGQPDAAGNLALLDGTRREIQAEVGFWLEEPHFKREVDEALSRGVMLPQWSPSPHIQKRDEKDEALARHKAA